MLAIGLLLFISSYLVIFLPDAPWVLSDSLGATGTLLVLFHVYGTLSKVKVRTCMLTALCCVLNVLYIVALAYSHIDAHLAIDTTVAVIAILATCIALRVVLLFCKCGNTYNDLGTFLVYKKPSNLSGYITALIYSYGSVRIVISGNEFKFKDGVFIESNHVRSTKYMYERINNIPVKKARSMLGMRWKWYRNCFTVSRGMEYGTKSTDSCKRVHGE